MPGLICQLHSGTCATPRHYSLTSLQLPLSFCRPCREGLELVGKCGLVAMFVQLLTPFLPTATFGPGEGDRVVFGL